MAKHLPQELKVSVRGPVSHKTGSIWGVSVNYKETDQLVFVVYYDDENLADQSAQSIALSLQKSLVLEVP